MKWRLMDVTWEMGAPRVMGILNLTPDSFSDGGAYTDASEAVHRGLAMVADGAAMIDVGAESTRPGSQPVAPEVQLARIGPVIHELRRRQPDLVLSIDTRSSMVARAAIAAGARLVNDVSALSDDAEMAAVVRDSGAGVILMHMSGRPETNFAPPMGPGQPRYGDLVADVMAFLKKAIENALHFGITPEQIAVDPGIGFGKNTAENLELLRRLSDLRQLGRPIVVGASRKRFIGEVLGVAEPKERAWGSVGAAAASVLHGADLIRVHDVRETVEAVRICAAIRDGLGPKPTP